MVFYHVNVLNIFLRTQCATSVLALGATQFLGEIVAEPTHHKVMHVFITCTTLTIESGCCSNTV